MISASSVVCALFCYSIVLFFVCLLRMICPKILNHGGAFILLLFAAVATVRLILPLELPSNYLIRSWSLLGTPVRLIRTYPDTAKVLLMIWAAGAVLFMGRDIFSLYRAYKTSSRYERSDSGRVREIADRLSIHDPIVVSPDVKVPYAEGIFRHTIYLPVLEFPEDEIGFILRHEAQHIRSHDSVIKFFFRFFLVVMWWNPITHWFWHDLDDLLELRCDAKMTEHMGAQERQAYANMLEGMKAVLTGRERLSPLVVDELFAVSRNQFLDQRLDIIRDGTSKPPRRASTVAGCVLAVLFCASYLVIIQPAIMPMEEKFEEKAGVNYFEDYDGLQNSNEMSSTFIVKGSDGRYQLYINYKFSKYLSDDEVASEEYQHLVVFEEDRQR